MGEAGGEGGLQDGIERGWRLRPTILTSTATRGKGRGGGDAGDDQSKLGRGSGAEMVVVSIGGLRRRRGPAFRRVGAGRRTGRSAGG